MGSSGFCVETRSILIVSSFKIVLKVLPSKHLTLHKQKLSHKVEKSPQCWLRSVTKEELKQYVERLPLNQNQKRDLRLNFLRRMPANQKLFESPYYWAAFCAIGQQTTPM
jgi:CHAT domain-containing protein